MRVELGGAEAVVHRLQGTVLRLETGGVATAGNTAGRCRRQRWGNTGALARPGEPTLRGHGR